MTATRLLSVFHVSYLPLDFSSRMYALDHGDVYVVQFTFLSSQFSYASRAPPKLQLYGLTDRVHVLRITMEAHREIECRNVVPTSL